MLQQPDYQKHDKDNGYQADKQLEKYLEQQAENKQGHHDDSDDPEYVHCASYDSKLDTLYYRKVAV
jgi:hypothetical protein